MAHQLAVPARVGRQRPTTRLLWLSIIAALLGAFAFSFAGMPLLIVAPATLALLATGGTWLIWFIVQLFSCRRPRPHGWIAAGMILALSIAAIAVNLPVRARFAASEPAFNQLVKLAGPPPVDLGENDPAKFPVRCPRMVGLYAIDDCQTTSGGYLFFDPLGNTLVDYAGFAYLPYGPQLESNGGFELEDLVHLHGNWYAFTASW